MKELDEKWKEKNVHSSLNLHFQFFVSDLKSNLVERERCLSLVLRRNVYFALWRFYEIKVSVG
jgi:hypothetical protein